MSSQLSDRQPLLKWVNGLIATMVLLYLIFKESIGNIFGAKTGLIVSGLLVCLIIFNLLLEPERLRKWWPLYLVYTLIFAVLIYFQLN